MQHAKRGYFQETPPWMLEPANKPDLLQGLAEAPDRIVARGVLAIEIDAELHGSDPLAKPTSILAFWINHVEQRLPRRESPHVLTNQIQCPRKVAIFVI